MSTYHCPACDLTFDDEEGGAKLCPQCQSALEEMEEDYREAGLEATDDYQKSVMIRLILAMIVVLVNSFIVCFGDVLMWQILEGTNGRSLIMFVNSLWMFAPAIFCFIKCKDHILWLIAAAMIGILLCGGFFVLAYCAAATHTANQPVLHHGGRP